MSRFFSNTDPDEKASASDFETDVVNFSGGQLVEFGTDRRVQKIDRIQTCRQMAVENDQLTVRPRQSDQIGLPKQGNKYFLISSKLNEKSSSCSKVLRLWLQ